MRLFLLWNRILAEEQTCLSHGVDSQVWWAVMKSYEKCKKRRRQDDMYFLISPVKISSQHSVGDFWLWNSFHLQFERPHSRNNKKNNIEKISFSEEEEMSTQMLKLVCMQEEIWALWICNRRLLFPVIGSWWHLGQGRSRLGAKPCSLAVWPG